MVKEDPVEVEAVILEFQPERLRTPVDPMLKDKGK